MVILPGRGSGDCLPPGCYVIEQWRGSVLLIVALLALGTFVDAQVASQELHAV